jgi:hypothetical protein
MFELKARRAEGLVCGRGRAGEGEGEKERQAVHVAIIPSMEMQ